MSFVALLGLFCYGSDRAIRHLVSMMVGSINLVKNVPNVVGLLIMEIIVITEALIW